MGRAAFLISLLHAVGGDADLSDVVYFSALARHLEASSPGTVKRHQAYVECLRATGVHVELARFKEKRIQCPLCRRAIVRHEEKETDVAIGARLVEMLVRNQCDSAVLVTGDSDIAPALRTARRLFPTKNICCCFPYRRQSLGLKRLANKSFSISKEHHLRHRLPDPFVLPDGRIVAKPARW